MSKIGFDALGLESSNKMAKIIIPNLSTGFFTFRMAKRLGDPKARRLPKLDIKRSPKILGYPALPGMIQNRYYK